MAWCEEWQGRGRAAGVWGGSACAMGRERMGHLVQIRDLGQRNDYLSITCALLECTQVMQPSISSCLDGVNPLTHRACAQQTLVPRVPRMNTG